MNLPDWLLVALGVVSILTVVALGEKLFELLVRWLG